MNTSDIKKYFGLTTIGILFQIIGNLCIIIASMGISRELSMRLGQFFAKRMKK